MLTGLHRALLVGTLALVLAGCNDKQPADASSSGSANLPAAVAPPPPAETPPPSASTSNPLPANSAPTISGVPPASIAAGSAYSFQPSAQDPEGGTLYFQITGKPAWATFSTSTGKLSGTPTQAGRHNNILITVSDGLAAKNLAAFSIEVTPAVVKAVIGSAVLSWLPPTENSDGSPLVNLSGYRVYHGPSADALGNIQKISNAGITTYVFDALPAGVHYFAISTVSASGVESALSAIVSKTIR